MYIHKSVSSISSCHNILKQLSFTNPIKINRLVSTKVFPSHQDDIQYEGPNLEKIQSIRSRHLGPLVRHTMYKSPPIIHHGKMQYLFDSNGKKYLDLFGGVVTVSVGHCHPKVNDALNKQLNTLWHTTNLYLSPKIHEYSERLAAKMPGNLKSVYLVNSGSEANDLAMLLARVYTGNFDIISFRNAYHGMSAYTMGLTAYASWRYPLPGTNSGIHHAVNPDPYRGRWGGQYCRDSPVQTERKCSCRKKTNNNDNNSIECDAKTEYLVELNELFKYSIPSKKLAGMFAESIQGVGGTIQYPIGYIKEAVEKVHSNGGLFISDEVQTGFGRTGNHFWGFESHNIMPDIVTMAKGIGNGFPMAAVVTTPEIANTLNQALTFNTFGGNPMASTVGIAVLDVIEEEKLQENSLTVGTYFLKGLEELRSQYRIIGDVRGKGLMIGMEMVQDKDTKTPLDPAVFLNIWENCKDAGVLFGKGGFHGNCFRIKPPMCITKQDVDIALDVMDKALKANC